MTLGLSLCWRGPPGSGKRHALQQQLQLWARSVGQVLQVRKGLWDTPTSGGGAEGEEGSDSGDEDEARALPMESSILHWGFDVTRMSLKDKQYIKTILSRWGRGGQVLGSGQRCLVFYHAHLLSSESVLYLQAFLEENSRDSVLWLTSEYPLPARLSDWCLEIPVAGPDRALRAAPAPAAQPSEQPAIRTLQEDILPIFQAWTQAHPRLTDVKHIRSITYSLLHRNIRWTDGFHAFLFALDILRLSPPVHRRVTQVLLAQPFTGSGQTVPSYRIPILWENLLCQIRNALGPPAPVLLPAPTKKPARNKKGSSNAAAGP